MKKLYIQPKTDVCEMQPVQMIATSPGVTGSVDGGDGPGYGGVDDGTNEPGVKGNSFEFEW